MAALFNELFTSVPNKIVQDLCMTDLGACPKFVKDFTLSNSNDDSVPQLKFSPALVSAAEILDDTNELLPKTSWDLMGFPCSLINNALFHYLFLFNMSFSFRLIRAVSQFNRK